MISHMYDHRSYRTRTIGHSSPYIRPPVRLVHRWLHARHFSYFGPKSAKQKNIVAFDEGDCLCCLEVIVATTFGSDICNNLWNIISPIGFLLKKKNPDGCWEWITRSCNDEECTLNCVERPSIDSAWPWWFKTYSSRQHLSFWSQTSFSFRLFQLMKY
jgi:hypothetical protein